MPLPNPRRSGGPRSAAGMANTCGNAFKTGVAAVGWYDPREEAEFNELLAELLQQYPQPALLMREDLRLLAIAWVKLRRLERRDNALHHQARILAQDFAAQRPENSVAALLPDSPQGRALALAIMGDAAMPPPERIISIERGRVMLERSIEKLMERIERRARAEHRPRGAGRVPNGAGEPPDISDAPVLPAPPADSQ